VKVTRWNYETLSPKAAPRWNCRCQQNVAKAAILTSEGDRESAVNSARRKAERKSSTPKLVKGYYSPSGGSTKTIILQAQAERQQQVLKAQATAEALQIIAKTPKLTPVLVKSPVLAQHYLEMGTKIGSSDSRVMFMDPAVSQPRWRGCVQLSQTWLRLTRTRCFQPNCHRSILTTAFIGSNASSLTELALFTQTKTPECGRKS